MCTKRYNEYNISGQSRNMFYNVMSECRKRNSECRLNIFSFFCKTSHQPTKTFTLNLHLSDHINFRLQSNILSRKWAEKQVTIMWKKVFILIFSLSDAKDNDWAELYGGQLCTASSSKKSHLQFWITQMSFSSHWYLNLKIYSILFILQESYTNDPFLNTCMVFPHLDTKYLIIYV